MDMKQRAVEAEQLLFEADRASAFITGSEAVMEAIKSANVEWIWLSPIPHYAAE
ncbi:MAG: hypothetical protein KGZ72_01280 [Roseovarius sp.]|jgi:hypothetical protein|nr:hypothetical protein [Roseovarius sp.]